MKRAAFAFVLLIILGAGWFFVSPLFIDQTVDEEFDFVLDTGGIDIDMVMSMPADKQQSMMNEIMDAAANAPDTSAVEEMPSDAPAVLARGKFVDADAVHKGSGTATLYRLPNNRQIVRFEDFRTTNGPALVVYLAKHASPSQASDVTDGGFISLGKLKGNVGNQNYVIPDNIDVAEYGSVVIWCELFGVLFSPASLSAS
ncbi:MAG: DM13 domain-containing protein [Woeseiaceae bacterium]